MIQKRLITIFLTLLFVSSYAFGQTTDTHDELRSEVQKRVTNLNNEFGRVGSVPILQECQDACHANSCDNDICDKNRKAREDREAAGKRIASEIRTEVDAYITNAVVPEKTDSASIEKDLESIFGGSRTRPEDKAPRTFIATIPSGKSLIIAYEAGGVCCTDTGATIQAYEMENGRFKPTAINTDMKELSLYTEELRSPLSKEIWLLAWGRYWERPLESKLMECWRAAVYAYDGHTFRTIWESKDIPRIVEVKVTKRGFAIKSEGTEGPANLFMDEYVIRPDGVNLISSHLSSPFE